MATYLPRKRFAECVVCRTTVIFPRLSEKRAQTEPTIFGITDSGQVFLNRKSVVNRPALDGMRLKEFFARFSYQSVWSATDQRNSHIF
jgi:hypothetical protein